MDESSNLPVVEVYLVEGPINRPRTIHCDGAGAIIRFEGIVRPMESTTDDVQRAITGLIYQVYEPMTSREMLRLATDQATKHGVMMAVVEHSYGFIGNGECSFVLQVASRHRKEAIAMVDEFIHQMKLQVPIWKVPTWAVET